MKEADSSGPLSARGNPGSSTTLVNSGGRTGRLRRDRRGILVAKGPSVPPTSNGPGLSRTFITVGSTPGSGADFDPGTSPGRFPGDSSMAIQSAINASGEPPWDLNHPCPIRLLPGVFAVAGSFDRPPIYCRSANQKILGSGRQDTLITLKPGSSGTSVIAFDLSSQGGTVQGPMRFSLEGFTVNMNGLDTWKNGIDLANANDTHTFKEGASRGRIVDVRVTGVGKIAGFGVLGDWAEEVNNFGCEYDSFSWLVTMGDVRFIDVTSSNGQVLGQDILFVGCTFNAPLVVADHPTTNAPAVISFLQCYFNGTPEAPCVVNRNTRTASVVNILGGYWKIPPGAGPAGWITGSGTLTQGNRGVIQVNILGNPTFVKKSGNDVPLADGPISSFNLAGSINVQGAQTIARWLGPVQGGGSPTVIERPISDTPYPAMPVAADQTAYIVGGNVSLVRILRAGRATVVANSTNSNVHLAPGDQLLVTFSVPPTIAIIPG